MPLRLLGRLHLSVIGKVSAFIRDWDPSKHPRGPGGLFADTPDQDKMSMFNAKKDDILATPSGQIFHVHKPATPDNEIVLHEVDSETGKIKPQPVHDVNSHLYQVAKVDNLDHGLTIADLEDGKTVSREPFVSMIIASQIGVRLQSVYGGSPSKVNERSKLIKEALEKQGLGPEFRGSLHERQVQANAALGAVAQRETTKSDKLLRKFSPNELDRFDTDAEKQYYRWLGRVQLALEDRGEQADVQDLMRIAVARQLGSPKMGQYHLMRPFMLNSVSDQTPEDMQKTVGNLQYMSQGNYELVEGAAKAAEQRYAVAAVSVPEPVIRAGEKLGVDEFMRETFDPEWVGGPQDYEEFLNPDPARRELHLENYLDTSQINPSMIETHIREQRQTLDQLVENRAKDAKDRWRANYRLRGNYNPAEKNSVEGLTNRELYDALTTELAKDEPNLASFNPESDMRQEGRHAHSRQLLYDMAVAKANDAQFEHEVGEYGIPRWDNVELQKQDLGEIQGLLKEANKDSRVADAPIFFTGGQIKDGIAQVGLDSKTNQPYAHAFVRQEFDEEVAKAMEKLGATEQVNSQDLSSIFTYEGSGEIYPGDMLSTEGTATTEPATILPADAAFPKAFVDSMQQKIVIPEHMLVSESEKANLIDAWRQNFGGQFLDNEDMSPHSDMKDPLREELLQRTVALGYLDNKAEQDLMTEMYNGIKTERRVTGKSIEYVPHDQKGDAALNAEGLTTGAPTSQRGQLRFNGYTPEEAVKIMKSMGTVENLEAEVPYDAVMRSGRRFGRVTPLLPAYVRGEANLPPINLRISHGITGGHQDLLTVLDTTAALSPISERIRLGIQGRSKAKTSPKGDIRSGLDEGLFATIGSSTWGEGTKVLFKDDAFLRRDINVSPIDFGGGTSRYDSYYNYKKKMREQAGITGESRYTRPWEAAARDEHLKDYADGAGSNEYNPYYGVPVEDWSMIYVPHLGHQHEVETKLAVLEERGIISERPEVTADITRFRKVLQHEQPADPSGHLSPEDEEEGYLNPSLQTAPNPVPGPMTPEKAKLLDNEIPLEGDVPVLASAHKIWGAHGELYGVSTLPDQHGETYYIYTSEGKFQLQYDGVGEWIGGPEGLEHEASDHVVTGSNPEYVMAAMKTKTWGSEPSGVSPVVMDPIPLPAGKKPESPEFFPHTAIFPFGYEDGAQIYKAIKDLKPGNAVQLEDPEPGIAPWTVKHGPTGKALADKYKVVDPTGMVKAEYDTAEQVMDDDLLFPKLEDAVG